MRTLPPRSPNTHTNSMIRDMQHAKRCRQMLKVTLMYAAHLFPFAQHAHAYDGYIIDAGTEMRRQFFFADYSLFLQYRFEGKARG